MIKSLLIINLKNDLRDNTYILFTVNIKPCFSGFEITLH